MPTCMFCRVDNVVASRLSRGPDSSPSLAMSDDVHRSTRRRLIHNSALPFLGRSPLLICLMQIGDRVLSYFSTFLPRTPRHVGVLLRRSFDQLFTFLLASLVSHITAVPSVFKDCCD